MNIVDYKIYAVKPRWIFLKLKTEDGLEGWGEMVSGTRTETVIQGAKEMCKRILGKNSNDIESIWQRLYRYFFRGGPVSMTIISGIEIALWDIKGKRLGVPIYELLGGKVRDSLKVYSWIGGDRPDNVLKEAKIKYDAGFSAIKMNGTEKLHYIDTYKKVDNMLERVGLLRDYFGNDLDIAVDFHGRVHRPMAKVLIKELQPYRLMFIEEPVLPEHNEALVNLYQFARMPIATGERLYTRWAFKDVVSKGVADIIQPDVILTGGILETKKIAAMAEAYDFAVAPHAPYGPIALAATFQVDACTPNVFIQEQSLNIHYNKGKIDLLDFVKNKEIFTFRDGFAKVPQLPGLGFRIRRRFNS